MIWWTALLAWPLLIAQALLVRRRTPLLPSVPSPHSGTWAPDGVEQERPFELYLVGESTIAGVGARSHETALSGQLARRLASKLGRPVHWNALGLVGARASDLLSYQIELELIPLVEQNAPGLIVIAVGVNDTTKLTSRARWRRSLQEIVARIRQASRCPILFASGPPMEHFVALPQPLRAALGARARMMDDDIARTTRTSDGCWHLRPTLSFDPEYLASDGFHPSELGYGEWARQLGDYADSVLQEPA